MDMNNMNGLIFKTRNNTIKVAMIFEGDNEDYTVNHEVEVFDEDMVLFKSLGKDRDKCLKQFINFIYEYQFNRVKFRLKSAEGTYKRALTYLATHPELKPEKKDKYILKATENKCTAIELEKILKEYKYLIRQLYEKHSDIGLIEIKENKLTKSIERKLEELTNYRNELEEIQTKKAMLTSK